MGFNFKFFNLQNYNELNMNFPNISKTSPLILASTSPRRKRLLQQIGLPFRSVSCTVNEENIDGDPSDIARILAKKRL